MRAFSDYNPIVIAVYILTVAGIAMLCLHPVLLLLSLLGAVLFFFLQNGSRGMRSHGLFLGLFVGMALINPLVSHNGITVLFVIQDAPITGEAVLYGIVAAGMVMAVLYWFRSFTQMMTEDKLLYLFGKLSPKLALILSMGLRYVPMFQKQAQRVNQTQTALGLYRDDNLPDRMKGGLRIFSIMVTWALENGIITADSMTARGYGIGMRSHFSLFRFRAADGVILLLTVFLGFMTGFSVGTGAFNITFYPKIMIAPLSFWGLVGCLSYGLLVLLPTVMEVGERIKWKYLRSKR